jgi:hypothetical protein
MVIRRADDDTLILAEIDEFGTALLQKIPEHASTEDSPAAHERLFSDPELNANASFREDWAEFVEPELRAAFETALDVIRRDLRQLEGPGPLRVLRLQIRHLEAWIHGLNQARLALAARHELTDEEMADAAIPEAPARAAALFHIRYYALLMDCFLEQLPE